MRVVARALLVIGSLALTGCAGSAATVATLQIVPPPKQVLHGALSIATPGVQTPTAAVQATSTVAPAVATPKPVPTTARSTVVHASGLNVSDARNWDFLRVNALRAGNGERALGVPASLSARAENFATAIANGSMAMGDDTSGKSSCRAGTGWYGANSAMSSGYGSLLAGAQGDQSAMENSAAHRAIMLDSRYTAVGVGVAQTTRAVRWGTSLYPSGSIVLIQDFCG